MADLWQISEQFLIDIGVLQSAPSFWQKLTGDGPASELWLDRLQIPAPQSPIVLALFTVVVIGFGIFFISKLSSEKDASKKSANEADDVLSSVPHANQGTGQKTFKFLNPVQKSEVRESEWDLRVSSPHPLADVPITAEEKDNFVDQINVILSQPDEISGDKALVKKLYPNPQEDESPVSQEEHSEDIVESKKGVHLDAEAIAKRQARAIEIRNESIVTPDIFGTAEDDSDEGSAKENAVHLDAEAIAKRLARADDTRKESVATPDIFGAAQGDSDEGSIEEEVMDLIAEEDAMNPDADKAVNDVESDVDNHARPQEGDHISTGGVEYVIQNMVDDVVKCTLADCDEDFPEEIHMTQGQLDHVKPIEKEQKDDDAVDAINENPMDLEKAKDENMADNMVNPKDEVECKEKDESPPVHAPRPERKKKTRQNVDEMAHARESNNEKKHLSLVTDKSTSSLPEVAEESPKQNSEVKPKKPKKKVAGSKTGGAARKKEAVKQEPKRKKPRPKAAGGDATGGVKKNPRKKKKKKQKVSAVRDVSKRESVMKF